jgi:hypothetical protein
MSRQYALIGFAVLVTAAGCTWQQAYSSAQAWQRNACYKRVDQTERDRCLSNTNVSYDEYRSQREGAK